MSSRTRIITAALCMIAFYASEANGMNVVKTSITGEFRYDSNANSGGSGEDYIGLLAPQIGLTNESRNMSLDASYRLTGNYYLKENGRNYIGHLADAGAAIHLSDTTILRAAYNFRSTEESREATLTNIQTSRTRIYSHLGTFSATRMFTPNVSAVISASETLLEFQNPALVDTRTDAAAITVNYRISDNTTVSPGYSFTNMDFDTGESIQSHTASVSAAYRYSPTIDLNASTGLIYSTTEDGSTDWQAGAGFVKALPRGSFSVSYARGITNTSGLTDQLNINDTLTAVLSHSLTERLSLGLSTSYSINRTKPESTVDIRSYQAGVSASWQAKNWLAVGARYGYFNQDSRSTSGIDFERNILSVNFIIHPYEYRN